MRLKGRTAVVTGATSGIGREIAIRFAKNGADICIGDLNIEEARVTVSAVEKLGVRAIPVQADVSSSRDVGRMTEVCVRELGRIDVLVNNAGIKHVSHLVDTSEELWDRVLAVNLGRWRGREE